MIAVAEEPDAILYNGVDDDIAAGLFRDLVHRLDDDARTICHEGLTFWMAVCGAVSIPTERPDPNWAWCVQCWPSLWPTDDQGPQKVDSWQPVGEGNSR
ncbi:hypothetical protein AB0K14_40640 [Actinosynnema sp. NPDC050801]|uniref:hypothetical protein n=1 Tax=unclassified Actinosynnema TaxID=2637065 RepID=UPI0033E7A254